MNEDTRVAVCCYEGDGHQVRYGLSGWVHHGCPLLILSPDDSRVTIDVPGCIESRYAGKRAYTGQLSLDRQRAHLSLLLEYPENHFLIHDADSVCLDPKIPDYLYEEPDVMWTNQVVDGIPGHQEFFPSGWPHVAFQPPYFLSRKTIKALLAVADDPRCQASPVMPFIDFYMVQLTMVAGLPWKRFLDGLSFPISIDPLKPNPTPREREIYAHGYRLAHNAVLNEGANVIHSTKDWGVTRELINARQRWVEKHPHTPPRFNKPPRIGRA